MDGLLYNKSCYAKNVQKKEDEKGELGWIG